MSICPAQDKDKLLKLTMEVKELRKVLDAEKAARSLASEELQVRRGGGAQGRVCHEGARW